EGPDWHFEYSAGQAGPTLSGAQYKLVKDRSAPGADLYYPDTLPYIQVFYADDNESEWPKSYQDNITNNGRSGLLHFSYRDDVIPYLGDHVDPVSISPAHDLRPF